MTIALGLRCFDGMVLATDSLESDGLTKRNVDKMMAYEVQGDWGIALACAGEADLSDSFTDDLKEILGNSDFDETRLLMKLRTALRQVRLTYPEAEFGFLATTYGISKGYSKMFRVSAGSSHLGPVTRYQSLGIGSSVANLIVSQFYTPSMCVVEGVRLAVLALSIVKQQVEGCDGPTAILSYGGIGKSHNGFTFYGSEEIETMEAEFSPESFNEALTQYWAEKNPDPPIPRPSVRTKVGGCVRYTGHAKLNSIR